jgi:hypothetical protein
MSLRTWRFRQLAVVLTFPLALGFDLDAKALYLYYSVSQDGVIPQEVIGQRGVTQPSRNQTNRFSSFFSFILPPKGAPGKRKDATTRDDCSIADSSKPLTALVPPTNIGLTISERPTFWFYVPYQSAKPVEFSLSDDKNNVVYKTTLQPTGTPGIVSINLPQSVPPLKRGKNYQWKFSYICHPTLRSKNASVYGYVERSSLDRNKKSQLEQATTPRERISLYAANGWWYDLLTTLAEERRKNPQDAELAAAWENLLRQQDIALEAIASERIVP